MTPAQVIARRIVLGLLRRMTAGRLELVEPGGQVHVLGPGGPPSALIHVRDPRAWTQLLRGSRGLASGYVAGLWESSDPTAVVRVAARNAPALDAMRRRMTLVREPYQRLRGVGGSATRSQSREDIRRHYDLGNDLFALMLDETLMYSAAYFETPETALHEASIAKLELVCDKLDLHAEDHVIEIGAGWGGFTSTRRRRAAVASRRQRSPPSSTPTPPSTSREPASAIALPCWRPTIATCPASTRRSSRSR
jgi:cyclopropane-fatty-acyl-phospholipid synthase